MSTRVLNPMQMRLFLDPQEHINTIVGSTDVPGHRNKSWETGRDRVFARKEASSRTPLVKGKKRRGAGVYDSVEAEGVREPVEVLPAEDSSGWVQAEGHHRLAAARAAGRRFVPVRYEDDPHPSFSQSRAEYERSREPYW